MKSLVVLCVIAGSLGEPPRPSAGSHRSQRFEIVSTTEPTAEPTTDSVGGPYPATGWKPAGAPFALPGERAAASAPYPPSGWTPAMKPFRLPQQRPPSSGNEIPDEVYGVPDDTSGEPTTDAPATDIPENLRVEKIEGPVEVLRSVGTYFVLLPSGRLQLASVGGTEGAGTTGGTASPGRPQYARRAPLLAFGR